jgi:DNA-binding response OmpR family regulator
VGNVTFSTYQRCGQNITNPSATALQRACEVSIRRLRAKIDDPFERKLIHTLRGVGYVLEDRE